MKHPSKSFIEDIRLPSATLSKHNDGDDNDDGDDGDDDNNGDNKYDDCGGTKRPTEIRDPTSQDVDCSIGPVDRGVLDSFGIVRIGSNRWWDSVETVATATVRHSPTESRRQQLSVSLERRIKYRWRRDY